MELRCYETVVIFDPDLEDAQLNEQIEWLKGLIEKSGGNVYRTDIWGKRKLAYEIEKKKEGYYVLVVFEGPPDIISELERNYRINHNVLRFLTVKKKEAECKKEEKGE